MITPEQIECALNNLGYTDARRALIQTHDAVRHQTIDAKLATLQRIRDQRARDAEKAERNDQISEA